MVKPDRIVQEIQKDYGDQVKYIYYRRKIGDKLRVYYKGGSVDVSDPNNMIGPKTKWLLYNETGEIVRKERVPEHYWELPINLSGYSPE